MFRLLPVLHEPTVLAQPREQARTAHVNPIALEYLRQLANQNVRLTGAHRIREQDLGACASSCLFCSSTFDLSQFIAAKVICSGVIDSCPAM